MNDVSQAKHFAIHPAGNATGKPETPYLLNCWYVAALSREVQGEAFLARQLLDTSVLLYRKADGTPVALFDPRQDAQPAMLAAGDEVRWVAVDRAEHDRLAAEIARGLPRSHFLDGGAL